MGDLRALVGASIKRLRQGRRLTQAALAEKIGRSVDMLSRLERGDAAPSFDTITALVDALEVEPAELFGATPRDGAQAPAVTALLKRIALDDGDNALWLASLIDHLDKRPIR